MSEQMYESPICPMCNRRAINLVAMEDSGKGAKLCQPCKRAVKSGKTVEKFNRGAVNFGRIEAEMEARAKAIIEGAYK